MKKLFQSLKDRWSRVSRKKKVLLYSIGIMVSVFLLYVVKDAPTDFESEFRRIEKAHLVGPGDILGSIPIQRNGYNRLLIAEDAEGYILYPYSYGGRGYDFDLHYLERTGDVTFFAEPWELVYDWENTEEHCVTVGIFDTYPEAVRAKIELTLWYQMNTDEPVYEKTYTLESQREIPGLFAFELSEKDYNGLGVKGYAIEMLRSLADPKSYRDYYNCSVPATVWLYGEGDTLLLEKDMEIISYARRAHE